MSFTFSICCCVLCPASVCNTELSDYSGKIHILASFVGCSPVKNGLQSLKILVMFRWFHIPFRMEGKEKIKMRPNLKSCTTEDFELVTVFSYFSIP